VLGKIGVVTVPIAILPVIVIRYSLTAIALSLSVFSIIA
jgi:hypothetical protein